jgi:hypothetical protein
MLSSGRRACAGSPRGCGRRPSRRPPRRSRCCTLDHLGVGEVREAGVAAGVDAAVGGLDRHVALPFSQAHGAITGSAKATMRPMTGTPSAWSSATAASRSMRQSGVSAPMRCGELVLGGETDLAGLVLEVELDRVDAPGLDLAEDRLLEDGDAQAAERHVHAAHLVDGRPRRHGHQRHLVVGATLPAASVATMVSVPSGRLSSSTSKLPSSPVSTVCRRPHGRAGLGRARRW